MIESTSKGIGSIKADALFIPVCEDMVFFEDGTIDQLIKEVNRQEGFKGKKDQSLTLYRLPEIAAKCVTFIGMGKKKQVDLERFRAFTGKCAQGSIKKKYSEIIYAIPSAITDIAPGKLIQGMMEGAYLGNHIHDAFKTQAKKKPISTITFHLKEAWRDMAQTTLERVQYEGFATRLAREWVNYPSNEKPPAILSRLIQKEALDANLTVKRLEESDLIDLKFGAMLSVAKGSENTPNLTILEYTPKSYQKTVLLVGKGVTFDSGGLSLKPSAAQIEMKADMAGSAAVAGVLIAIGKIKPETRVIGIIPFVENMPSGKATRPGDVIKSYKGKTIEIQNTDAEGRLILADAISYGIKTYEPDTVIDVATLTGACVIALGEKIAGLFSNSESLTEKLMESSKNTDERVWHMPLPNDYKELLKSDFADICNISSSKYGGAITAALFLSEFAENTDWAHIDIAGPSYHKSGSDYAPPGGSGFGVRLLCDFITNGS